MDKDEKKPRINQHYDDGTASVLRKKVVYTELRFYQRSDADEAVLRALPA